MRVRVAKKSYIIALKLREMNISKSDFQLNVVNRVRELRIERNVSQNRLASLLLLSNGQIGNIESPKYQHKYTLKQLKILSHFFNVNIAYWFTGENRDLSSSELINQIIKYDE